MKYYTKVNTTLGGKYDFQDTGQSWFAFDSHVVVSFFVVTNKMADDASLELAGNRPRRNTKMWKQNVNKTKEYLYFRQG